MTAARSTVAANAGSPTFAEGEWTTTIRAALDWPPKFCVDQLARLHGLRAGRLPACARERVLDAWREDAESDGEHEPRDEHGAEVVGRPGAEAPDRADGGHRAHPRFT